MYCGYSKDLFHYDVVFYGEFKKKHLGVNLLSLQLCVHEEMLKILCEKGSKLVSRCWRLLLEDFRGIALSFDK